MSHAPGRLGTGEEVVVVHPFVEAALVRVARRANPSTQPTGRPVATRLVGDVGRVAGLATVLPDTSLLLLGPGPTVELRPAGSVVGPALVSATAPAYLVLSHRPVSLDLLLGPLSTVDGRSVERVSLRLTVRLVEPPSGVVELAREHGAGLEDALLRRLHDEVVAQVTAAVRMNRLADLERLSLSAVLDDGWLTASFVGGLLLRCELRVLDVGWPTEVGRAVEPAYVARRAR